MDLNYNLQINTKKLIAIYKTPTNSHDIIKIIEVGNDDNFAEPTAFGILSEDTETEIHSISLYPALHEEHFTNLVDRITTLMDATYPDSTQRTAVKKLMKDNMNSWYNDNIKHSHARANDATIERNSTFDYN
jgi:hypothetical protein